MPDLPIQPFAGKRVVISIEAYVNAVVGVMTYGLAYGSVHSCSFAVYPLPMRPHNIGTCTTNIIAQGQGKWLIKVVRVYVNVLGYGHSQALSLGTF